MTDQKLTEILDSYSMSDDHKKALRGLRDARLQLSEDNETLHSTLAATKNALGKMTSEHDRRFAEVQELQAKRRDHNRRKARKLAREMAADDVGRAHDLLAEALSSVSGDLARRIRQELSIEAAA
jgi:hypothetical protein